MRPNVVSPVSNPPHLTSRIDQLRPAKRSREWTIPRVLGVGALWILGVLAIGACVLIVAEYGAANAIQGFTGTAGLLLIPAAVIALGLVYFLPSIIAVRTGSQAAGIVVLLNIVLGWTLVGWVVCMAIAGIAPRGRT
jgi:hypothetical protein